jgi:uncharacterized protein
MAVAPCGARADEATKQAKVRELLMTMHQDRTVDSMMHSIAKQLFEVPDANRLTPAQQKLTQDFQDRAMKVVSDRVGWKVVEPDYVKLYENTYSEQEINGILAFYKSPAGQAVLTKAPQLSAGVVQIVHSHMGDYQTKMQVLQDDYMKQMTALIPANTKKPGH